MSLQGSRFQIMLALPSPPGAGVQQVGRMLGRYFQRRQEPLASRWSQSVRGNEDLLYGYQTRLPLDRHYAQHHSGCVGNPADFAARCAKAVHR